MVAVLVASLAPLPATGDEPLRLERQPLGEALQTLSEHLGSRIELRGAAGVADTPVSVTINRLDADLALAEVLRGFDYYVVVGANVQTVHVLSRSGQAPASAVTRSHPLSTTTPVPGGRRGTRARARPGSDPDDPWVEHVDPEQGVELLRANEPDVRCSERWVPSPTAPDGTLELLPADARHSCRPG